MRQYNSLLVGFQRKWVIVMIPVIIGALILTLASAVLSCIPNKERVELPDIVTTSIYVSGTINGQSIKGAGGGVVYTKEGLSKGIIIFSAFPENFHPSCYGKSWKCKSCHGVMAIELPYITTEGKKYKSMNLYTLAQGNFDVKTTKIYPNGDIIHVSAQIRMTADATHIAQYTHIEGKYTGPTDIVDILPSKNIMRPAGPGKINTEEIEILVRLDGSEIKIKLDEEISLMTICDGKAALNKAIKMPFTQVLEVAQTKSFWDPENLIFYQETKMAISPHPAL